MSQKTIVTTGKGESLKSGFEKCNQNFTELYNRQQSPELATQQEALEGTNDSAYMSPLKTAEAIAAAVSPPDLVFVYQDSTNGNDSNSGRTPSLPVQTIAKALTLCVPGSTLFIARNTVTRETMNLTALGSITVKPYGSGDMPVMDASNVVPATWTNYSGIVWRVDVTMEAGTGTRAYPGMWEDGNRLTEYLISDGGGNLAGVVALLQANPGSFYFAGPGTQIAGWSAGVKTFYISASDSGNPNSNGKTYEHTARARAIQHAGAQIYSICARRMFHHDGLVCSGVGGYLEGVVVEDFARHGFLDPYSYFVNCRCWKGNPKYPGSFFHAFKATYDGYSARYKGCVAVGAGLGTGFFSHGSTPGTPTHNNLIYEDCQAIQCATGFGPSDVNYVTLSRCKTQWCGNDTGGGSQVKILLKIVDCEFVGASLSSIQLMQTPGAVSLLRTRIASAIVFSSSAAPIYTASNSGPLSIESSEIVNQGEYNANSQPSIIFVNAGSIDRISIRDSAITVFNGSFVFFVRATGVTTWDIPDGELLLGGIAGTSYSPIFNVLLGGVTSTLQSHIGTARYLALEPRRLYQGTPIIDGFAKRDGAPWPVTVGYNNVIYSGAGNQQPRVFAPIGKRRDVIPFETLAGRSLTVPASELFGGTYAAAASAMIVCGENGLIERSTNGTTWTTVGAGVTTATLRAGAATTGINVLVGDGGAILRSTDNGVTWVAAASSGTVTASNLYGATFGTSVFCAVGDGGVIITSSDGDTWTLQTSGTTSNLRAVASSGSLFTAVGPTGEIRTSPTGATWTSRTSNTRKDLIAIGYGDSRFIAVGSLTNLHPGELVTSTDGTTWTPIIADLPFEPTGIAYGGFQNIRWILSGRSNGFGYSYDGFNWTFRALFSPNFTKLKNLQCGIEGWDVT